ncbi:Transposon TX1 uncharacterized 149 kDa protein [Vitis vinifera]|uniref:Transposon TX1 uncharacterized 149 kDa protein n=1 Tax=Vitis vinifera TaxID=29760 RepID=A0A438E4T0_VITVI|nr:Transposon TX1 uncharacterized 149 kDa protein [Vitis vinifera]
MEMNRDKALGPDGFTVAFWQSCWDFVKEEIVDLFKEFFDKKSFAMSLNTTFLVLIPKKGGAEDLGDFKPISLLGGLYKLLAKVLANRLKKVLDKVVSADQNAFVRGRQILDASLIANEVIDFWHKCFAQDGLWISLDGVDWWCISTAKFSVLVNGVPAGYFSNSRGLRQGDPLSPYLFVLGMEVLSVLIRKAVDEGFISGCSLRGRGRIEMNVSHLLFADDTIIFYEARKEHLTSLSWILAWFEAASGLRINLAKSELISVGEVEDIDEMAVELGCRVGSLPTLYLGLPLGANHKASSIWDGLEERMRRRDLRISSEEDSVIWKGGGHGSFWIRDAYKLLAAPSPITFPKKSIWVDKVPTKVAFFAWEATWEKILTLDRLQRRGSSRISSLLCLGLNGCSQRQSKSWVRVYMGEESSSLLGFLEWFAVP